MVLMTVVLLAVFLFADGCGLGSAAELEARSASSRFSRDRSQHRPRVAGQASGKSRRCISGDAAEGTSHDLTTTSPMPPPSPCRRPGCRVDPAAGRRPRRLPLAATGEGCPRGRRPRRAPEPPAEAAAAAACGTTDVSRPRTPSRRREEEAEPAGAAAEQQALVRGQGAERPRGVDQGSHRAPRQDRGAGRVLRPDHHPGRAGHRDAQRQARRQGAEALSRLPDGRGGVQRPHPLPVPRDVGVGDFVGGSVNRPPPPMSQREVEHDARQAGRQASDGQGGRRPSRSSTAAIASRSRTAPSPAWKARSRRSWRPRARCASS